MNLELDPETVRTQPPRSPFRDAPFHWRDLLIGLAPLVAYRLVLWLRPSLIMGPIVYFTSAAVLIAWMVHYPTLRLKVLTGRQPIFWRGWRHFLVNAAWGLLFVVVGWIVMMVVLLVEHLLVKTPSEARLTDPLRQPTGMSVELILFFLIAVAFGPLAEEVFCRGFLYNGFKRYLGFWPAGLLQAVLFAVLHPFPLIEVVLIFFVGVVLWLLYAWRQTLLAPLVAHMGQNITAVIVLLLGMLAQSRAPVIGLIGEDVEGVNGFRIEQVIPGGPAEEAGLRDRDIVVGLNGEGFRKYRDFILLLREHRPGDTVTVQFYREGELMEARPMLRKRQEVFKEK